MQANGKKVYPIKKNLGKETWNTFVVQTAC